jgi:glycerate kinase
LARYRLTTKPKVQNILIASDKFKGSLSANEVGEAIRKGLQLALPDARITIQPMADGGDGSLAVLQSLLKLTENTLMSCDPLGRPVEVSYLSGDGKAFIEVASASGLVLLKKEELDPLQTSTYGTGLMIKHALDQGITDIYLLLGGSATNDLGLGIAVALGYELLDKDGEQLVGKGENLLRLQKVNLPVKTYPEWSLTLLCDVTNPAYGPRGAAHVYAAQKGANAAAIAMLDAGMQHAVKKLEQQFGGDLQNLAGGGAAGGIGAGLSAILNAKLQAGFPTLAKVTGLEQQIAKADIVITGEGKLDTQSLQGKVVDGIADLCRKYQKELHVIAGRSDLEQSVWQDAGIKSVKTITEVAEDELDAMRNASKHLTQISRELGIFLRENRS